MATLPSLPNEVLLNIIEELLPDDLPNVALSCKHMQALSRRSLISYRECKKKYAIVKFHGCPKKDSESHLPALLRHMISDHKIAFHPRSLILERHYCSMESAHSFERFSDNGDNEHSDNEGKLCGHIEKLSSTINQFGNETTKTNDETTDQRLGAGKVWLYKTSQWSTMLGLVLTTFPNIETLTLRHFSDLLIGVQHLLWNAVEKNRGPGHTGPTILTKLKTVIVNDSGYYGGLDDAEVFACFALFPSVERLVGNHLGCQYPLRSNAGWTMSEYLGLWHPSLAVTEIDFQDSALTTEYFSQLLCRITRLKRFSYGYLGGPLGGYFGTDPYQLIDLLLLHSKSSLEYLEFKGFGCEPAFPPDGTGYGCLRDFEALKEVRVHAALWTIHQSHLAVFPSRLDCIECEEYIVFPLVEILPSSIETVHFEGAFHMPGVNHLLTGLTMSKGRRLRNLKRITFRRVACSSALMLKSAKMWMEDCAKMGICLDFEWNKWLSDLIFKR